MIVLPLYVLVPVSVSVPVPTFVSDPPAPPFSAAVLDNTRDRGAQVIAAHAQRLAAEKIVAAAFNRPDPHAGGRQPADIEAAVPVRDRAGGSAVGSVKENRAAAAQATDCSAR